MNYKIGDWTVDEAANLLMRKDNQVRVEKRVMAVLSQLVKANGNVVSKNDLIVSVWNGAVVSDHSVANAISDLRRALGDDRRNSRYIETIPKRGYRLIARHSKTVSNATSWWGGWRETRRLYLVLFGLGVVVAAGMAFWFLKPASQTKRLYLANIENATNDPTLSLAGEVGSEMMMVALAGGDYRLVRWRADDFNGDLDGVSLTLSKHDRLLSGRIVLDQETPILTLQLIDPTDGASVWAEAYDFGASRFVLLAEEIVADLSVPLGLSDSPPPFTEIDSATIESYWRARYLWSLREHTAIREAHRILTDITSETPDFAPAHAALADIYAHKSAEELALERTETFVVAEMHLNRALALDPTLSDALVTKAFLKFYRDRDSTAATEAVRRAISENPDNAIAWQTKAMVESAAGKIDESLQSISHARKLDPLSASMMWDQVWFLYIGKRYDDALEAAARARRLSAPANVHEALIHQQRGDLTAAFEHWKVRAITRGLSPEKASDIGLVAQTSGSSIAIAALANEALENPNYYEHPVPLAAMFIAAGNNERAITILAEAPVTEKSWLWRWFDLIPAFDDIRDDIRLEHRSR